MKKTIFTLLICSLSIGLFSQSNVWSKADRNNVYDDCISYITKYKNTTTEQRESISLCYLDEVTKKYTKADFEAKIDIEIKRIKEAIITQCAKNLGIDLTTEAKKEEVVVEKKEKEISKNVPSKAGLIGKWKTNDNAIIEFKENGSYTKKYLETKVSDDGGILVGNLRSGDWFLDEKGILTIRQQWSEDVGSFRTKLKNYTSTAEYKFITFSDDYIKFSYTDPNVVSDPFQANRIKD